MHADSFFLLPFLPAIIAMAGFQHFGEAPVWVMNSVFLTAQYLGYFLFIFVLIKLWNIQDDKDGKETANDSSDKNPSAP